MTKNSFASVSKYTRGDGAVVHYVVLNQDWRRSDLLALVGRKVVINGVPRRLEGIEARDAHALISGETVGMTFDRRITTEEAQALWKVISEAGTIGGQS